MSLDPKSRAYDPTYKPTKSLEQLVAENPDNQFLADRLAEQRAAQEKPSGMNSRRSNILPIAVGCIIFLTVKIGLDSAGTILGIPSYIDYGYTVVVDHGLYDEEKDGSTTDFGFYGLVASAMLAWRAFYIVKTRSLNGGLDPNQRRVWAAWLLGTSIYTLLSVAINFTPIRGALRWYVKLALAAAVFWLGRRIFEYFVSKAQREETRT